MNWVGGSRTRVLIKQERRKQKEYFERNKLRSKMKLMGVLSPVKNSTVSLDLLNLYMVNQISCKKKTLETIKKPTHVNMNRDVKVPLRKHNLELPMSPYCVPSKLCIDDIENNTTFQRLGSKEDLEAVQSSQDRNSYRIFGHQLNRRENCHYSPPCCSAELPGNRYIPKHFTPKFTYDKQQNEQLSNNNCSDPLVSKLNQSQDILSSQYKIAHFGTLFERTNNSENDDCITKNPVEIMREDCGNLNERQPDFIIGKQSLQHIWEHNGKEFSKIFEDVNHPTQRLLSKNHDIFSSQNMINLLSEDQQRIKETFDKCGYDSFGDICADHSDENYPADGHIRGIFTVPESALSNSTFTCYPEKCQPNKSYQKEYNNNEINTLGMPFEKECYSSICGKNGKLENSSQEKAVKENYQEYAVNLMGDTPVEGLYPKQSCDSGLCEVLMEGRGTYPLKGTSVSTKKNNQSLDSSQSGQSASYSPRATDSSFSSSSDMLSEDEALFPQQTEDPDKMSRKATKTVSHFCLESMAKHVGDTEIHEQNENLYHAGQFPQSQCNSEDILHTTTNDCMLQVARFDVAVQTQREGPIGEKLDVAIQCSIISECACRRDVSSLCNVESHGENNTEDTTGGQEILKNS